MKQENIAKKPEPEMSYVTIVLRYFDKNKKLFRLTINQQDMMG